MKKLLLGLVSILAVFSLNAQENLLTNGTFDGIEGALAGRTSNEWGMWSGNGGTAEVISGVVNVTPVAAADNWNMQVEQWQFAVENDVTYTVQFDAWADADRVIALTIEDPANGYYLLGTTDDEGATDIDGVMRSKWNIDITTTQATYTRTLTVDAVVANTTPKFAFLLAQTADMVYLDNVSLVAAGTGVNDVKKSGLSVYPNPAEGVLHLSGLNGAGNVVVFNTLGARVCEYQNVNGTINVEGLNSGVYMIRVTVDNGDVYTSKFVKK
ncbi:MAG: T9SS type A sorting domain-containing protein [Bacteroidota bacterium]